MPFKLLPFFFLFLLTITLNAQEKERKFEQGTVLGSRMDTDEEIVGFGIEGGYYLLKQFGGRHLLSADFRLAYAQSERMNERLIKQSPLVIFDSIWTLRSGIVNYKSLSLAIPIKYRFQPHKKIPLYLMTGINAYFNISNDILWEFDEFEYNRNTQMNISEENDQEEKLEQKFYNFDSLLAGLTYRKNRLMIDLFFSGGYTDIINNLFFSALERFSLNLSIHYKLIKK